MVLRLFSQAPFLPIFAFFSRKAMNQEDFSEFFTKLLIKNEKIDDSAPLFSMHKSNPLKPENIPLSPESIPADQDQSPTRGSPISESAPPPSTQDQADAQPFEEAVPLEDELANLLDDID